jgi:hypothetical protein
MFIYTPLSIVRSTSIIIFLLFATVAFSQEDSSADSDTLKLKDIMPVNTITVGLGRAYDIFSGDPFSNIGFDYLRRFHEKWEVGLQLDIDWKKNFTHFEGIQIAAIAAYSITNKWPVFAGFGIEGTEEHSIGFLRVGTEYTFFIDKKEMFFIAPGSFIDMNTESVTPSLMIAVGINW